MVVKTDPDPREPVMRRKDPRFGHRSDVIDAVAQEVLVIHRSPLCDRRERLARRPRTLRTWITGLKARLAGLQ